MDSKQVWIMYLVLLSCRICDTQEYLSKFANSTSVAGCSIQTTVISFACHGLSINYPLHMTQNGISHGDVLNYIRNSAKARSWMDLWHILARHNLLAVENASKSLSPYGEDLLSFLQEHTGNPPALSNNHGSYLWFLACLVDRIDHFSCIQNEEVFWIHLDIVAGFE